MPSHESKDLLRALISPEICSNSSDEKLETIPDILKHSLPMDIKAKAKIVKQSVRRTMRSTIAGPENIPSLTEINTHKLEYDGVHYTRMNPSQFRRLSIAYGGLVKDEYRRIIWPALVHNYNNNMTNNSIQNGNTLKTLQEEQEDESIVASISLAEPTLDDLKEHKEWNQVEMDVHRTLARFPPNIDESKRISLQDELTPLIVKILWKNPEYNYYQGFHDICLTFLLVLGRESAEKLCEIIAERSILNEFLVRRLEDAALPLIKLIYVILSRTDSELEWFMRRSEVGTMFALPWLLTWFAHSLSEYDRVVRLFDFFLAAHQLMPVYFASALVLFRGADMLNGSIDCDMPHVHQYLSKIPPFVPLEALISDAQDLFVAYPPSQLTGKLLKEYENKIKADEVLYGKEPRLLPIKNYKRWQGPWFDGNNFRRKIFSPTVWAPIAAGAVAAFYIYTTGTNPFHQFM